MKFTKINPPPVPQPLATVNIEMNEREAKMLMCLIGKMSASEFKTYVDKSSRIRNYDIPSPHLNECFLFIDTLYNNLENILN